MLLSTTLHLYWPIESNGSSTWKFIERIAISFIQTFGNHSSVYLFHSLNPSESIVFFSLVFFSLVAASIDRPSIAVFSSKVSRDRPRKRSAVVFIARTRKAERGAAGRMVRKKRPAENGRGRKARKEKQMRLDATASKEGERVKEEEDAASNANGMQEIASRFPVSLFSLLSSPHPPAPAAFSVRKNLSKKPPLLKEHESRTGETYRTPVSLIIASLCEDRIQIYMHRLCIQPMS